MQPKTFYHAQQSATDALKTPSKKNNPKNSRKTDALIGNKTASRITKFSKTLQRNNSETVTNEHDNEIPKKRYIWSKEKQKKINDLRLI